MLRNVRREGPNVRLSLNPGKRLLDALDNAPANGWVRGKVVARSFAVFVASGVVEDERFHLRSSMARTSSRTVSHGTPLDSPLRALRPAA